MAAAGRWQCSACGATAAASRHRCPACKALAPDRELSQAFSDRMAAQFIQSVGSVRFAIEDLYDFDWAGHGVSFQEPLPAEEQAADHVHGGLFAQVPYHSALGSAGLDGTERPSFAAVDGGLPRRAAPGSVPRPIQSALASAGLEVGEECIDKRKGPVVESTGRRKGPVVEGSLIAELLCGRPSGSDGDFSDDSGDGDALGDGDFSDDSELSSDGTAWWESAVVAAASAAAAGASLAQASSAAARVDQQALQAAVVAVLSPRCGGIVSLIAARRAAERLVDFPVGSLDSEASSIRTFAQAFDRDGVVG